VPKNVRRFVWLWWAYFAITAAGIPFVQLPVRPEKVLYITRPIQIAILEGVLVIELAIFLPFFWLAVWRRKNWARWVMFGSFVVSLPLGFIGPTAFYRQSLAVNVIDALSGIALAASFYFLFTGDAEPWFRGGNCKPRHYSARSTHRRRKLDMKAFRIVVDGKALGDLGIADFSVASVIVDFGRPAKVETIDYHFRVGGLTQPDKNGVSWHYRWACPTIQEGARIEIEIVDSDNCVPPTRLYRSDREVQESPFTEEEMRDLRYKDYLELKREFEPKQT
jgi:hypothetical protein